MPLTAPCTPAPAPDPLSAPGVGEVAPVSKLTCLRVAPVRTTTYELSAYGRDNLPVRQQLVIVVK